MATELQTLMKATHSKTALTPMAMESVTDHLCQRCQLMLAQQAQMHSRTTLLHPSIPTETACQMISLKVLKRI
jgi:hypothetical protein